MNTQTTGRTSQSADGDKGVGHPKKGDRFRCAKCGMEIQVTSDCRCQEEEMVHFHCCGQELEKA